MKKLKTWTFDIVDETAGVHRLKLKQRSKSRNLKLSDRKYWF